MIFQFVEMCCLRLLCLICKDIFTNVLWQLGLHITTQPRKQFSVSSGFSWVLSCEVWAYHPLKCCECNCAKDERYSRVCILLWSSLVLPIFTFYILHSCGHQNCLAPSYTNDHSIEWQNLNPLTHPNATLAPQARQARSSLNFLLSY